MKALGLAVVLLPAVALADVRGRVWSGDEPAGRAAILLEPVAGAVAPAPRVAHLDEVWLSFVPKVQVVPPGSTLVFTARDNDSHTVHARYGGETLFNRASVPHGPEQRAVLDRPGVVTVTCDLHAEMRAWVLVSASPFAAVSEVDGRFTVAAPAGRYRVRVWRPGDAEPVDDGEQRLDDKSELAVHLSPQLVRVDPIAVAPSVVPAAPRIQPHLPHWMQQVGARQSWPGGWADYVLSVAGVPVGFALAWALFWLFARRRGSVAAGVLSGCALAFALGALAMVGLSAAVATGLGFGAFMGTVIVGAHRIGA